MKSFSVLLTASLKRKDKTLRHPTGLGFLDPLWHGFGGINEEKQEFQAMLEVRIGPLQTKCIPKLKSYQKKSKGSSNSKDKHQYSLCTICMSKGVCLLTLLRRLVSLLGEFVILIDNSYFNVVLIEAQGKDRKEDKTVLQTHSQLLVNTGKLLRKDIV